MAATITFYECFAEAIADGRHDLDTSVYKVALFTSTYTPVVGTDTTFSVIDTNEIADGDGYSTGGATLGSVTWAETGGTAKFDAADTEWTASGSGITARYAVLYNSTTVGAGDIVAYILMDDSPADVVVTAGNTLTLQWNASGIFTLA